MGQPDAPAAIVGTFVKISTMSDGTPRVVLDLDCTLATAAALNLAPGAPVVIARMAPQAAKQDAQQKTVEAAGPDHGRHYQVLFTHGWFHNPKVAEAFGLRTDLAADVRTTAIKEEIYRHGGVGSLADMPPGVFRLMLRAMRIEDTLPRGFGEAP